jgi:hypothetical protein
MKSNIVGEEYLKGHAEHFPSRTEDPERGLGSPL